LFPLLAVDLVQLIFSAAGLSIVARSAGI
jgi:hypothetical protein